VQIPRYFEALYRARGRQHWWPAESPFEVIVGAYLTQNTSWNNVERALAKLRNEGLLSIHGIRQTPRSKLERLIRSSGYFRQKARRIKAFVTFLDRSHAGSLTRMFLQPTIVLREELLGLNGVGPETADSILLYAGNHPVFVVDAYTRRIFERHGLAAASASYDEVQRLFEQALRPVAQDLLEGTPDPESSIAAASGGTAHPASRMSTARRIPEVQIFNEMHGLIVGIGKNYCKKSQPECERCPLQKFLPSAQ
jgi:endonuclease-3 related protein